MKRSIYFFLGTCLSICLGYVLGYLKLPFLHQTDPFWMGGIAGLSVGMLLMFMFYILRKRTKGKENFGIGSYLITGSGILVSCFAYTFWVHAQNGHFKKALALQTDQIVQQEEKLRAKERIESATLLNDLFDRIEDELDMSPGRVLPGAMIERISILNSSFEPVPILKSDSAKNIRSSHARGQLLLFLSKINMDPLSYAELKKRVSFAGADLEGADLKGADLRNIVLHKARLRNAQLSDANLSLADLRETDLWGATLERASLRGADCKRAMMDWVRANEADFREADLDDVSLNSAKLIRADFRKARLRWGEMKGASLQSAKLGEMDLLATDLTRANLNHVQLARANLRWAILYETRLEQANMHQLKELTKATVKGADWFESLSKWDVQGLEEIQRIYQLEKNDAKGSRYSIEKKPS